MSGLLDRFHAFVEFQRLRQHFRSRVTDVVLGETARIGMNTNERGSVRPKRARATQSSDGRKEEILRMLGLLDRFYTFVDFQRFCNRCHPMVTDGVTVETARIAKNTKRKGSRDSVRPKDKCTQREREREEKEKWRWKEGGRERWFECLAYSIFSTLLLSFTASATALAPGSPMLFSARLHDFLMNTKDGIVK